MSKTPCRLTRFGALSSLCFLALAGGACGNDSNNDDSTSNGSGGDGSAGNASSTGGSGSGGEGGGPGGSGTTAGGAGEAACPEGASRNGPYERVTVADETSAFGLIDPSVEYEAEAASGLLTYTAVPGFDRVHIAIASSNDEGATWTRVGDVNEPAPITISTTDLSVCGSSSCEGTIVYESSSIIVDRFDPDPDRLLKVFSHAYFFGADRHYDLGYVAMHTARGPEGPWQEIKLFGWDSSSSVSTLEVVYNVTSDPALPELHECVIVGEPGAIVRPMGNIDLVLACPAVRAGGSATIDIRLLRSIDHGDSWKYVATLLTADDAEALGATSRKINGGDLFYAKGSYYLIATPIGLVDFPDGTAEGYRGCLVIPVEDLDTGSVARCDDVPVVDVSYLGQPGQFVGACSTDEGALGSGVLIPVPDLTSAVPFQLFASEFATQ